MKGKNSLKECKLSFLYVPFNEARKERNLT